MWRYYYNSTGEIEIISMHDTEIEVTTDLPYTVHEQRVNEAQYHIDLTQQPPALQRRQ